MFGTTRLVVGEKAITDDEGVRLAEIRRPEASLRRLLTSARDGLRIVAPDETLLWRMELPDGPELKSLWVEDAAGARIGDVRRRRRWNPLGAARYDIVRDGTAIGTAACGSLGDSVAVTTASGDEAGTARRQSDGAWFAEVRPGLGDEWTVLLVALAIGLEEVRAVQFSG
ncbi:hypothetical protein [Thermomonospora cellulosilytica]|uniref:Uncharacterized protein n=1 Tax=Thermomonospora cellulosilytica TaxID=1411118 RepID=A0A7W3MW22_9ACTN|nr:hypothetical protein [Thermomonospora cellulosilytica]MBA9002918.1 hypothetical protein [Thermomonospora cellulosilytica]